MLKDSHLDSQCSFTQTTHTCRRSSACYVRFGQDDIEDAWAAVEAEQGGEGDGAEEDRSESKVQGV